jgi:hypothetical protein
VFAAVLLGGVAGTAVGINWVSAVMVLGMALLIPLPWRKPGWTGLSLDFSAAGSWGTVYAGPSS